MSAERNMQKNKVYNIVKRAGKRGVTTPTVMQRALNMGISTADRRLRELRADGFITGFIKENSRVKVWTAVK